MIYSNMHRTVMSLVLLMSFGLFAMEKDGVQGSPRKFGSQDSPRKLRSSSLASPRATGISPRLNRSGSLSIVAQAAVANDMKRTNSADVIGKLKKSLTLEKQKEIQAIDDFDREKDDASEDSEEKTIEELMKISELPQQEKDKITEEMQKIDDMHARTRLRTSKSPREKDEATLAQEMTAEDEKEYEEPTNWSDWQGHEESTDSEEQPNYNARPGFVPPLGALMRYSNDDFN